MQPKSSTTSSPALDRAARRTGVRLGAVRARTRRSGRSWCRRAPVAHLELEPERDVALGRPVGRAPAARRPSASSPIAHAARMRATSAGSFTRRRSSTRCSVGTSSASGNHSAANAPLLGPRDAVGLEPEAASTAPRRRSCASRCAACVAPDLDAGRSTPGSGELLGGLLAVAAVGDEARARPARRAPSPADPVNPVR